MRHLLFDSGPPRVARLRWLWPAYGVLLLATVVAHLATAVKTPDTFQSDNPEKVVVQAGRFAEEVLARNEWTPESAFEARDYLLKLQNSVIGDRAASVAVNNHVVDLVHAVRAWNEARINNQFAGSVDGVRRAREEIAANNFRDAFFGGQPTITTDNVGRNGAGLANFLRWLFEAWAFSWPFALLAMFLRVRGRNDRPLEDEIRCAPHRPLLMMLFGELGVEFFDNALPAATVHSFKLAELFERINGRAPFSHERDYIAALAIRPLGVGEWHLLADRLREQSIGGLLPQLATVSTWAVGAFLFSLLSLAAPSAARATEGEAVTTAAVATTTPVAFEAHGFGQMLETNGETKLERARLLFTGRPNSATTVSFNYDVVVGLQNVEGEANIGSGFSFRAGQLLTRAGWETPAPHKQVLVGGLIAAGALISVLDIGAEAIWRSNGRLVSLAVLSGSGPNKPDDNSGKDVMLGGGFKSNGLTLEGALQSGNQPKGWRTRGLVHAALDLGSTFFAECHLAFERLGSKQSWGASPLLGVRLSSWLQLIGGYDGLWFTAAPVEHVVRTQLTFKPLGESVNIGVLARWSRLNGYDGLGRVQFAF